jgi:hypothetical protein
MGSEFAGLLFFIQPLQHPSGLENQDKKGKNDDLLVFPTVEMLKDLARLHPTIVDSDQPEQDEQERQNRERSYNQLTKDLTAIINYDPWGDWAKYKPGWEAALAQSTNQETYDVEKIIAKFKNIRTFEKETGFGEAILKKILLDSVNEKDWNNLSHLEKYLTGYCQPIDGKRGKPVLSPFPKGYVEAETEVREFVTETWNLLNDITRKQLLYGQEPQEGPIPLAPDIKELFQRWVVSCSSVSCKGENGTGKALPIYRKPVFENRETYKITGWLYLGHVGGGIEPCPKSEEKRDALEWSDKDWYGIPLNLAFFHRELRQPEIQRQYCRWVWDFLRKEGFIPIKVLNALHSRVVTGRTSAKLVCRVRGERQLRGKVTKSQLETEIIKERGAYEPGEQDDEENITYKINWHLNLAKQAGIEPYLAFETSDEGAEEKSIICTRRAERERLYLEGMAGIDMHSPKKQFEAFEKVLEEVEETYRPVLRKLARAMVLGRDEERLGGGEQQSQEMPKYDLYEALYTLYVASVTNYPTLHLLALMSWGGLTTQREWQTRAENSGILIPKGQTFDLWFLSKCDGLIRCGVVAEVGKAKWDRSLELTEYGRQTLEEVGFEASSPPKKVMGYYSDSKAVAPEIGADLAVKDACLKTNSLPDEGRNRVMSENGNLIRVTFGNMALKLDSGVDSDKEPATPDAGKQQLEHPFLFESLTPDPLKAGLDAIASTNDLEMIRQLKKVIEGKEAELRLRGVGQETASAETSWVKKVNGMPGTPPSHEPEIESTQVCGLIDAMKEFVATSDPDQARQMTPVFQEVYDGLCDKAGMDFGNEQDLDYLTFGHYKHQVGEIKKSQPAKLEKAIKVDGWMEDFLGNQVKRLLGIKPKGKVSVIETARPYKVKNINDPTGFEERVSHSKKISFTGDDGKQRQIPMSTIDRMI